MRHVPKQGSKKECSFCRKREPFFVSEIALDKDGHQTNELNYTKESLGDITVLEPVSKKRFTLRNVCDSCKKDLQENPNRVLLYFGKACFSCGMPFGLITKEGIVRGRKKIQKEGRSLRVCDSCYDYITYELENGVLEVLDDLNEKIKKVTDKYNKMLEKKGNRTKRLMVLTERKKLVLTKAQYAYEQLSIYAGDDRS